MDSCKSCKKVEKTTDAEISEALDALAKIGKMRFAEDDLYQERIAKCSECRFLEAGTTCLQCGCYVKIRARLLTSRCPYPKTPQW